MKHENTTICISNSGKSAKFKGLYTAQTSSKFDKFVARKPLLLIQVAVSRHPKRYSAYQ